MDMFSAIVPQVVSTNVAKGVVDGIVMGLVVRLYNPSIVSFDNMGVLNLTMVLDGVPVGYVYTTGPVALKAGWNEYDQTGKLAFSPTNNKQVTEILTNYSSGELLGIVCIFSCSRATRGVVFWMYVKIVP